MGLRVGALMRSWAWHASRAELRRCALDRTEGGKREWAARLGCPRLGRAQKGNRGTGLGPREEGEGWEVGWGEAGSG